MMLRWSEVGPAVDSQGTVAIMVEDARQGKAGRGAPVSRIASLRRRCAGRNRTEHGLIDEGRYPSRLRRVPGHMRLR